MKQYLKLYLFLIFFVFFSCSIANEVGYVPTIIPDDVEELFIDLSARKRVTPTNENIAILFCQGGPAPNLDEEFDFANENYDPVNDPWYQTGRIYKVHQAQTFNPNMVNFSISFEQCQKEAENSIIILDRVIDYFISMGKRVYLTGGSYGFFVIQHYIYRYGISKLEGVVMAVGRFDMPKTAWHGFRDGIVVVFEEDGETTKNLLTALPNTIQRLAAAIGKNRYTQLLQDKDLSRVIVYTTTADTHVGKLNEEEIKFMENLPKERRPISIIAEGLDHTTEGYNAEILRKLLQFRR